MQVCEIFSLIADLAIKDGVAGQPLGQFWERDIGAWHVSLNRESISRKNAEGDEVPAFTAAVKFNGWPAGLIDPRGGIIAAGEAANEDTFIEAIRAEIENHTEQKP